MRHGEAKRTAKTTKGARGTSRETRTHTRRGNARRFRAATGARRRDLWQADRRFFGRESAPIPIEVVGTRGCRLYGSHGRSWIDFTSGWCVGNLGWDREELIEAARSYDGPDYVAPSLLYAPWVELAEALASITPGRLRKCFRATGGTEAVEIALRGAMAHTGRRKVLALEGAYHGNSFAALSLGDEGARRVLAVERIAPPLDAKAADTVETRLAQRDIAAFILEPMPLNLGIEIPEPGFFPRVAKLCRRYGTLLVMDEVATGFGRTGALFASEHFGIEPDLMCLAKAISGGVAPIGAVIATPDVGASMEEEGSFYSTYGWHPRSVAVSLANLRIWKREGSKIVANVEERSQQIQSRLGALFDGATLRAKGLAIALELGSEASRISRRALDEGLLLSADDEILMLMPPLTLSRADADDALDALERASKPRSV